MPEEPWIKFHNIVQEAVIKTIPKKKKCKKAKWLSEEALQVAAKRREAKGKGDGFPAELFQILKGDTVKLLHSICQQIWKTQQWPQDWES